MNEQSLQSWLESLIHGLVSFPQSVQIEKKIDEEGILFIVKVHESDRGKVIGKEGSIATAVRTVLRSAGRLIDLRASMKVDVPGSRFELRG